MIDRYTRGWATRRARHGSHGGQPPTPVEERFWSKVRKGVCWEWLGPFYETGYGYLYVPRQPHQPQRYRKVQAHRLAYELLVGPIPAGLVLDHLCRNPKCVNPEHLEPVTSAENVRRGVGMSVRNSRKQTCPRGHPYDIVERDGTRRGCRQCKNRILREWRVKAKAEGRRWY